MTKKGIGMRDRPAILGGIVAQEGCQPSGEPKQARWDIWKESTHIGLLIVLVAMFLIFSLTAPNFLTFRNMAILASSISMIGIVAGAMTLVIIGGNLDLSAASIIALTSMVVANVLVNWHWSEGASVIIGMLVGLAAGLINGTLIARLGINSVIATLATYSIFRWTAYLLGIKGRSIPLGYAEERPFFDSIGQGNVFGVPVPFILMALILLAIWFFLARTRYGREFFAVGGNPLAATLTGISVRRYTFFAFTLTGLCAAISGIIFASRLAGGYPGGAMGWELDIVTAVFLGGTSLTGGQGSILGTFLGVLIIGTLRNGMALLGIDITAQNIATGGVLLLAVLYDRIRRGGAEL
jgi:ribose/xylose/arabinose/galactoside ABC-type transport system permease subunit